MDEGFYKCNFGINLSTIVIDTDIIFLLHCIKLRSKRVMPQFENNNTFIINILLNWSKESFAL